MHVARKGFDVNAGADRERDGSQRVEWNGWVEVCPFKDAAAGGRLGEAGDLGSAVRFEQLRHGIMQTQG